MNRLQLVNRVRIITRDLDDSIFRKADIYDFLNEGIDRVKQSIQELVGMIYLPIIDDTASDLIEPILLPAQFHVLLAIYASSRCFYQDERHYQASNLMNEFETKLAELKALVESGEVVITNVDIIVVEEFVEDTYFVDAIEEVDLDDGVEGVE